MFITSVGPTDVFRLCRLFSSFKLVDRPAPQFWFCGYRRTTCITWYKYNMLMLSDYKMYTHYYKLGIETILLLLFLIS